MDYSLKNKVAFVTGGSHGLGKAICLNLTSKGASVAINYRKNPQKVEALIEEIENKYGIKPIGVKGDITIEKDVKRMFNEILKEFGRIDILVNNSGICPVTMIKDMSLDEWESVIKTNLTGTFITCREMINILINKGNPGKIINVASQAAFNGSKNGKSHYSASKGGVVSFTVSLAKEVAQFGINVNAIAPGLMYTEMTAELLDKNLNKYKKQIPLGRIATLDEVAEVVSFLASEGSNYITGATIDVSGGLMGR